MISKLSAILERFEKLSELVSDPEVIKDIELWQKYVKERAEIEETANKYLPRPRPDPPGPCGRRPPEGGRWAGAA